MVSEQVETRFRRREAAAPARRFSRLENAAAVAAVALRERRIPFWSLKKVQELQRRRIRAVVEHAYATVPFYQCVMDERGLRPEQFATADDLAQLPMITGADLA